MIFYVTVMRGGGILDSPLNGESEKSFPGCSGRTSYENEWVVLAFKSSSGFPMKLQENSSLEGGKKYPK